MRISDWSSDVCSSDLTPSTCVIHGSGPEDSSGPVKVEGASAPPAGATIPAKRAAASSAADCRMRPSYGLSSRRIEPADGFSWAQIAGAPDGTQVTNAPLVCRLLTDKQKKITISH